MRRRDALPSWLTAWPFLGLLAYAALAASLVMGWGMLSPGALAALLIGIAVIAYAARRPNRAASRQRRGMWIAAVVALGLLNLTYLRTGGTQDLAVQVSLVIAMTATGICAVSLSGRRAAGCILASGLLWLALVGATWPAWGRANIDVFGAVTGATGALLHGHNPYTPTFPYLVRVTPFLAVPLPGHFEYGPIVPVIYAAGWLVGDVRLMNVIAVIAIAAGLWWLARQRGDRDLANRILLLALISPLNIFMIQNAWVEIWIVAGIVWWMALRRNHARWSVAALSVALMVNALAVPLLLPFWLWSPRARRQILAAACITVVVVLPFALVTGLGRFAYDTLGFQLSMGAWYDSLTLTSYLWQLWNVAMPGWLLLVGGAFVVLVSIRRGAPTNLRELALQGALFLAVPMLVAKWAFFNYYFLSATMLMLAIAEGEGQLWAETFRLPRIGLSRSIELSPSTS